MSSRSGIETAIRQQIRLQNSVTDSIRAVSVKAVDQLIRGIDTREVLRQLESDLEVTPHPPVRATPELHRMSAIMQCLLQSGGAANNQFTVHAMHQDDVLEITTSGVGPLQLTNGAMGLLMTGKGLVSDLTYVSSDVMDLLAVAGAELETEPLRATDLITPNGFCYMETPLVLPVGDHYDDGHAGVVTACRAFSWVFVPVADSHPDQVVFFLYSDRHSYLEVVGPRASAVLGEEAAKALVDGVGAGRAPDDLFVQDINVWHLNQPWDDSVGVVRTLRQFFLAMMRFCWQQLLVVEPAGLSRPIRRYIERKGGTGRGYNVLRLRRVKRVGGATGEGLRLDHRVLVRGHWRNHHYPSLGAAVLDDGTYNAMSHRRIWIEPHVKGPDDAPLRVKHKVTVLAR